MEISGGAGLAKRPAPHLDESSLPTFCKSATTEKARYEEMAIVQAGEKHKELEQQIGDLEGLLEMGRIRLQEAQGRNRPLTFAS